MNRPWFLQDLEPEDIDEVAEIAAMYRRAFNIASAIATITSLALILTLFYVVH